MKYLRLVPLVVMIVSAPAQDSSSPFQSDQDPASVQIGFAYGEVTTWSVSFTRPLRLTLSFGDNREYESMRTDQLRKHFNSFRGRTLTAKEKVSLAKTVVVLSNRKSLEKEEFYDFASLFFNSGSKVAPDLSSSVSFDDSENRVNEAFLAQLKQPAEGRSDASFKQCPARTPVIDLSRGLALGFFEATQDATTISLKPGDTYSVVRKFRRAADDVPENPYLPIYAIAVSADPQQSLGFTVVHPSAPLAITESGRLLNKDFQWEIKADGQFHGGKVNLKAELLRFDTLQDLEAGRPAHREAMDIPIASLDVSKPPSQVLAYLKDILDVGQKFFGFIGAIPTGVLVFLGIRKRRRGVTVDRHSEKASGATGAQGT